MMAQAKENLAAQGLLDTEMRDAPKLASQDS